MYKAHKIRNVEGILIGEFQEKKDRDQALRKFCFGFPEDE